MRDQYRPFDQFTCASWWQAENAAMEAKLQLDKRVSFRNARPPADDEWSMETEAPRDDEVAQPALTEVDVEEPAKPAFELTALLELFAKVTGGAFCVPCKEMMVKAA